MKPQHARRDPPRITPLVVMICGLVALSGLGTLLVVAGLARGELVDKSWKSAGYGLFSVVMFAMVGFLAATRSTTRIDVPEVDDTAALVRVRSRFGVVFWVLSAMTAGTLLLTFIVSEKMVASERVTELDSPRLAVVGMNLSSIAFILGVAMMFGVVPGRIFYWRNRTHLYLSADGIGWAGTSEQDAGSLPWSQVRNVNYSSEEARGWVHTHCWQVYQRGRQTPATIRYPVGATPRPRYIRRTIRELAPGIELTK